MNQKKSDPEYKKARGIKIRTDLPCPFCKKRFTHRKAFSIQGELHCPFCKKWIVWLPAQFPKLTGKWLTPGEARAEPFFKTS